MAEVREKELAECLSILGVKEHHWLDYVDDTCEAVPHEEAVLKLEGIFNDVQPDSVLTFGPEGLTGHPDHMAVSRWTSVAFDRFANERACGRSRSPSPGPRRRAPAESAGRWTMGRWVQTNPFR